MKIYQFFDAAPQSKQSGRLFLQLSQLGLPHALTRKRVLPPPPCGSGGAHLLAGKGVGCPYSEEGTDTVVL
jgi:hypothetical protein